jgi:dihydroxyacetone kinase-like predicted kinase
MICEEDILKVHVHVKNPGKVFNKAQEFGEFSKMKSENMASQATEAGHIVEGGTFHVTEKINENELAIIAVSNGLGLDEEFATLGVNKIVSGGQSMNPSVQDFVDLIESLNYKNIVLLPNNSNIILTAETVKNMIQDKNIFVLGTKTLQQGLVAMYNISKEMIDFENYEEGVTTAFKGISEGQITIAVRDTEMNGVTVKDGQFISLKGKEILSSTDTLIESAKILVDKIIADKVEVITLINNEECSDQQLLEIEEYISSKDSSIDIERIFGGQSVYHLLIFGEE